MTQRIPAGFVGGTSDVPIGNVDDSPAARVSRAGSEQRVVVDAEEDSSSSDRPLSTRSMTVDVSGQAQISEKADESEAAGPENVPTASTQALQRLYERFRPENRDACMERVRASEPEFFLEHFFLAPHLLPPACISLFSLREKMPDFLRAFAPHAQSMLQSVLRPGSSLASEDMEKFFHVLARKILFDDMNVDGVSHDVTCCAVPMAVLIVCAEATGKSLGCLLTPVASCLPDLCNLLYAVFSDQALYGGFREGGVRIVAQLSRLIQNQSERKAFDRIVRGLCSGYYAPDDMLMLRQETLRGTEEALGQWSREQRDAVRLNLARRVPALWNEAVKKAGQPAVGLEEAKAGRADEALAPFLKVFTILEAFLLDAALVDTFAETFGFGVLRALAQGVPGSWDVFSVLTQLTLQVDALRRGTAVYAQGLEHIALTLPTAGKDLAALTYLPSLAACLQDMVARGRLTEIASCPILVFDQSEPKLFQTNRRYVDALVKDTKAWIVHVSMDDVLTLGARLGLRPLFDTTGEGAAGYGGARNIAFLLGPVIRHILRDAQANDTGGFKKTSDISAMLLAVPPAQLARYLHEAVTGHTMVLMGDDDTTLLPGFLEAKAVLAAHYSSGFAKFTTQVAGRDTTAARIPFRATVVDLMPKEGEKYDSDTWQFLAREIIIASQDRARWAQAGKPVWHNMAGVLMHPSFCLDLPLPTEEMHFAHYQTYEKDYLAKAIHHCGDRLENDDSKMLASARYFQAASLVVDLVTPNLHWNHAARNFTNVAEAFAYIASGPGRKQSITRFLSQLLREREKPSSTEAYSAILDRVSGIEADYSAFIFPEPPQESQLPTIKPSMDLVLQFVQKQSVPVSDLLEDCKIYETFVAYLVDALLAAPALFSLVFPTNPEGSDFQEDKIFFAFLNMTHDTRKLASEALEKLLSGVSRTSEDALMAFLASLDFSPENVERLGLVFQALTEFAFSHTPHAEASPSARNLRLIAASFLYRFADLAQVLAGGSQAAASSSAPGQESAPAPGSRVAAAVPPSGK